MTPPFVGTIEGPSEAVTTARGLAPDFRPNPGFEGVQLDPEDPNWTKLDELRQQAWDRGITPRRLREFDYGFCPDQVIQQISKLEDWLKAN